MSTTFITIAAAAAALLAGTASAQTSRAAAYEAITAGYQTKTGTFCIRSGWAYATSQTRQWSRKGECHTAADWRKRGIAFDAPKAAAPIAITSR